MDLWKFFSIGHARHAYCNPFSATKFDELIELFDLPSGGRVLDIACGKGELLARTASRWGAGGVGVDISPYFCADARARIAAAGHADAIEIVEGNGSEFDAAPGSFDAAFCIGATWVFGGLSGTLAALADFVKPGGLVMVGEPHWLRTPSPEYLAASSHRPKSFDTHAGNIRTGLDLGLSFLHAIASSQDDWDRYEGLQCGAAERYAEANPADPDVPELLERVRTSRDLYLRWGRDELGWAVYLFGKPSGPVATQG